MPDGANGSMFDFSTIDLAGILPTFLAAVGAGIVVAVSIVAIKKGINWLMGMIKRA